MTFLKYFYDTVKTGSVQSSSKENFVSSAAVSNGIKTLEAQLQVELLVHKRKAIEVTHHGFKLYRRAEEIFKLIDDVRADIDENALNLGSTIRFCINSSLAESYLAEFLVLFYQKYPHFKIEFKTGGPLKIKNWVHHDDYTLGINLERKEVVNYNKVTLHKGHFVAIQKKSANFKLGEEQFILSEPWPEIIHFRKRYNTQFKKSPDTRLQLQSWHLISKMAKQGLGVGIVPDYIVANDPEIRQLSYDFTLMDYQIVALWKKNRTLSVEESIVIHELENFFKKI